MKTFFTAPPTAAAARARSPFDASTSSARRVESSGFDASAAKVDNVDVVDVVEDGSVDDAGAVVFVFELKVDVDVDVVGSSVDARGSDVGFDWKDDGIVEDVLALLLEEVNGALEVVVG